MREIGKEIIFNPNADNEVRSKILSKTGFTVCDRIYFESISKSPINMDQAKEHQHKLGYPPIAYDFGGYTCEYDRMSDRYISLWYCWASTGD